MPAVSVVVCAVAAIVALYAGSASRYFAPDACERLERILATHVVGQNPSSSEVVLSVCAHLRNKAPVKPLVISVHGPPGVGKSLTHHLAALAMYGLDGGKDSVRLAVLKIAQSAKRTVQRSIPLIKEAGAILEDITGSPLKCPGPGCAGYKVLYGMDFTKETREMQHAMIRKAILSHAKRFTESLIVVEEYDKLDCDTRTMLRQIINHPEIAGVSLAKSTIFLESNLGMHELQLLLQKAGGSQNVAFNEAYHTLKDIMAEHWSKAECGGHLDALKMTNIVDVYVPYFPLERKQIQEVIERRLAQIAYQEFPLHEVIWSQNILDYIMKAIQFEGPFAVDGAKDVLGRIRRVFRAIKESQKEYNNRFCITNQSIEFSINKSKSKDTLRLDFICRHSKS